jgi:Uma2 family endonuclease
MPVTWATYARVAMEDVEGAWELHDGRLHTKGTGSWDHNDAVSELGFQLAGQLDRGTFSVRINGGRVRCSSQRFHLTCFVPDVLVVPHALTVPLRGRPNVLEVYDASVPLVVEVWDSPDRDDTDVKIDRYRRHGDLAAASV